MVTIRNTVQEVKQVPGAVSHAQAHRSRAGRDDGRLDPDVECRQGSHGEKFAIHASSLDDQEPLCPAAGAVAQRYQGALSEMASTPERSESRQTTMANFTVGLESFLGYLHLTGKERLLRVHPDTRQKLALKRYDDDREQILTTPTTVAWDDLFILDHIKSFITWHAWRIHTPKQAEDEKRAPSKPSTLGLRVAETMVGFAKTFARTEYAELDAYKNGPEAPRLGARIKPRSAIPLPLPNWKPPPRGLDRRGTDDRAAPMPGAVDV